MGTPKVKQGSFELAALEDRAQNLRRNLAWDAKQLAEIHELYGRYVALARPFPLDLEEHSLRLILKFVRPNDAEAARRLVTVLRDQNKLVPENVSALAGEPAAGPPLDPEAVLAQIESGVVEREPGMAVLADLTRRGQPPPLILEMKALEYFIADDPSRIDLKKRLHTVLRLLGRTAPAELSAELRAHFLEEEYAIDYQRLLDDFGARVRFGDMEPEFRDLLEKVRRFTMATVERLYALWTSVRYIAEAGIPGDFVEAGVWRGGSVMLMAHELLRSGSSLRPLWLYDTFAGLPRPDAELDVDVLGNRGIDGWQPRNLSGDTSVWAYANEEEGAPIWRRRDTLRCSCTSSSVRSRRPFL